MLFCTCHLKHGSANGCSVKRVMSYPILIIFLSKAIKEKSKKYNTLGAIMGTYFSWVLWNSKFKQPKQFHAIIFYRVACMITIMIFCYKISWEYPWVESNFFFSDKLNLNPIPSLMKVFLVIFRILHIRRDFSTIFFKVLTIRISFSF